MKSIISALIALSVIAGVASVPASALDAGQFWKQYDQTHGH